MQGWAGPGVDPVAATTPQALRHPCQGFEVTGGKTYSPCGPPSAVRNGMFAEPEGPLFHSREL